MNELIALAFDSVDGTQDVRDERDELQKEELLRFDDTAVVARDEDGHVNVQQVNDLASYDFETIRAIRLPEAILQETFPTEEVVA